MQGKQQVRAAQPYIFHSSIAVLIRQVLEFEKAAVFASLVLEFSLVFAEHVHANCVVVFRYWAK